ncbi:MAG: TolB family protein [Candidatus Solibacter usitatus]|nr:TolB family protein [Candidatus Solibacter usitatus]
MKAAGARCEVLLINGAPHGVEGWEKQPEFHVWKPRVVSWLRAALLPDRQQPSPLGIFDGHSDVGAVTRPGSAAFDAAARTYTITGSGENMWAAADAFHFAWKKTSGDVALTADIAFPTAGGNPHRKAVLIIRQSLDPDSAYVDVALHGDGLTSIQYRDARGAATHEVQANVSAPRRLRLEKRGNYFYMLLAAEGQEPALAAGTGRMEFQEPFYAGLGVCSHDKDASDTAVFSNVDLSPAPPAPAQPVLYSALETISVASTDRRVVRLFPGRIEAPNWTPDGTALLYNSGGGIYRIPAAGGSPALIDTGFATRNNNDHGISPDGKWLAISDQSQEKRQSLIYVVPIAGGTPRRVTPLAPSYWHGWSPDGLTLVYCAQRDGEFDIYSIPAAGGEETRLTTAKGLDDGPEFSPTGEFIYFNSDRTGRMQIWRMKPDGSDQQQVTFDDVNNWFAHPSPDGKRIVFLTFEKDVQGHPPNKDVSLRLMNLSDGKITVLARLFGGQGTINTPSWSPDSRRVAFVSHHLFR